MAVQNTTTAPLSANILAVYDRTMLKRAVQTQVFDRFGQAKSIPAKSNTKTAFAYRYKNILPALTPLAEYNGSNIKAENKIVREEISYSVGHYGDYIKYSDELDLYDLVDIKSAYLDILSDQASLTVDTIRRDVLRGGNNVIFTDGAVSRLAVADGAKVHTYNDFKIMAIKLKNQGAKKFKGVIQGTTSVGTTPIRSAYVGICSPEVVEDLRGLTGWKNVEDYASYGKIMDDEVGSIGDFRIIESTNNEPVVQVGTDTNDHNIHLSLFMGEDAYATITLRGKQGIQTKVKPLGSAGSADPLDQYGTIGWKAIIGCAILNEAWLIRTEAVATIEDAIVKHYMDFS